MPQAIIKDDAVSAADAVANAEAAQAALDALYAVTFGITIRPAIDAMLTIRP